MMVWKMIFLFNWVIFWFHVNLPGGNHAVSQLCQVPGQELPLGKLGHGCLFGGDVREVENVATSHGRCRCIFSRKKKRPTKKPWEKTPGEVFFGSNEKKKNAVELDGAVFVCGVFFQKWEKLNVIWGGVGWYKVVFCVPGEMGFFYGGKLI